MRKYKAASAAPLAKVTGALLSGALVAVLLWVLKTYAAIDPPEEVQQAVIIIVSFVVSYFIPLGDGEVVPVE